MSEFAAIAVGGLVSSILLLSSHMILWPYQDHIHKTALYTVGTACLGVGMTVVAALLGLWILAITFWTLAGTGGALIVTAWWIRGLLKRRSARADRTGYLIELGEQGDGDATRSARRPAPTRD